EPAHEPAADAGPQAQPRAEQRAERHDDHRQPQRDERAFEQVGQIGDEDAEHALGLLLLHSISGLSWSGLSRPSIQPLARAFVDGWILGTSPRMTARIICWHRNIRISPPCAAR